jgi:hypothetical protein
MVKSAQNQPERQLGTRHANQVCRACLSGIAAIRAAWIAGGTPEKKNRGPA